MIRLITGLPGHGKTLWAVTELIAERGRDDARPLFVDGIRGLTVPHTEIDARKWPECPDGSIIVVDECQRVWPTRGAGTPPEHVALMATHRHRGIDFWIITQHPGNLDSFIRERLVDEHVHVFRVLGTESAMVYRWNEVQTDPRSESAKALAISAPWPYPKSSYAAYSSAVMHTAKRRIPWRRLAVVGLGLAAPLLIWGALELLPGGSASTLTPEPPAVSGATAQPAQPSRPLTPEEWLAQYSPRIPSRPESAPAYDRMMATAEPPKLMCIDVELAGCTCYTDQLTKWQGVPEVQCKRIALHGQYQLQTPRANNGRRS